MSMGRLLWKRIVRRITNVTLTYVRSSGLPKQAVILLTNPRSGSTWFADALRCHPAIEYWTSYTFVKALKLTARRYPFDLSNVPGAANKFIEVEAGVWERIPFFNSKQIEKLMPKSSITHPFALEKIHPQHYDFQSENFINAVSELRKSGTRIVMIYQTRDPRASIVSFLKYQKRNPMWLPNIARDDVVPYTLKNYNSLLEVAQEHRGLIIDYSDLDRDLPETLQMVYSLLWPNFTKNGAKNTFRKLSEYAVNMTKRENRVKSNSAFFGQIAGKARLDTEYDYQGIFSKHTKDMSKIYESYNALMERKYQ